MSVVIRWAERALSNLAEIRAYIALDSEHYADVHIRRIFALVEELAEFPEIGRKVPSFNDPALRERWLGHYRIVYRISPDHIDIVTIRHGARLVSPDDMV